MKTTFYYLTNIIGYTLLALVAFDIIVFAIQGTMIMNENNGVFAAFILWIIAPFVGPVIYGIFAQLGYYGLIRIAVLIITLFITFWLINVFKKENNNQN